VRAEDDEPLFACQRRERIVMETSKQKFNSQLSNTNSGQEEKKNKRLEEKKT
jgi:hypothetical protein